MHCLVSRYRACDFSVSFVDWPQTGAARGLQGKSDTDRRATEFEIASLTECAHLHVIKVLGTSNVDNETFIAMERCEGDLMRHVIAEAGGPARHGVAEETVAVMMRQVRFGRTLLRTCSSGVHFPQQRLCLSPRFASLTRSHRRSSRWRCSTCTPAA